MKNSYRKPLGVSTPEGKRIIATVTPLGKGIVKIQLPYLEAVKKDGTKNGRLGVITNRRNYGDAITKITRYMESLFLKEMSNDNSDTGKRAKNKSGRNPKYVVGVDKAKPGGERTVESIHSGSRRNHSSESNRKRKSNDNMASEDNRESEESSEGRD